MTYGEEFLNDLKGMHKITLPEELQKEILESEHGAKEIMISLDGYPGRSPENDPWSGQSPETRGFKETMNTESFPPMTGDEL